MSNPRALRLRRRAAALAGTGAMAIVLALAALAPASVLAGAQQYEPLSAAVRGALAAAVKDRKPPEPTFGSAKSSRVSQPLPRYP